MTVNELIQELKYRSEDGWGDKEVYFFEGGDEPYKPIILVYEEDANILISSCWEIVK